MKSFLVKAGLLTALFFGLSHEEFHAASEWASKCSSFGEIKKNENPSFQHINCLLTNAALDADIPPEVVKAVANQENNGWFQFKDGKPEISGDGGIGIMQVTTRPKEYEDEKRLKEDIIYNIEAGIHILNEKYNYKMPKISGAGRGEIENWYFPVMAYNGTKPVNSPIVKSTGLRNTKAYQELVFARIENESFLGEVKLAKFPFKSTDFEYDSNSAENIKFLKATYKLTDSLHTTNYSLNKGNRIIVTVDGGKIRNQPSTAGTVNKYTSKNTILEVTGEFTYDKDSGVNQFVWFPVKTLDGKSKGFIASSSIKKYIDKTAPLIPTVNSVSDKSTLITGKAEANATVYAKVGTKEIGKATAKNGVFSIKISKQKAGTSISVYAVDAAKNKSVSKTVKVTDKTAPGRPTVNVVTDKTTALTGKAEKNATVYVKAGTKQIGKAATKNGAYSIKISKQKAGTSISVFAIDAAGNKSASKTVKVADKTAPTTPTVSKITSKTVNVTGKGEKASTVYIYNGSKKIGQGTVDSRGTFKVKIPAQKKAVTLKFFLKDKAGNQSASKSVKVS